MKSLTIIALAALLAGCGPDAAVNDISGYHVTVRGSMANESDFVYQAILGCGHYGKAPVQVSKRCVGSYCAVREYLFACTGAGGSGSPRANSTAATSAR